MTHPNDTSGFPEEPERVVDPDAPQSDAEQVAAQEAADSALDAELEAEIEEALSEIDPDVDGDGEVSDIEAQLAERTEDLQRVSAEYANYRKRTERERQGIIDTAKAGVVLKLLPILDDLDLARQHGDLEQGPLKSFGDKLSDTLNSLRVEPFGVEGEVFDPEIHEAVQDLSSGEEKALGTVLRRGYRLGEKVVRTAMVIIADPSAPAQESQETDSAPTGE